MWLVDTSKGSGIDLWMTSTKTIFSNCISEWNFCRILGDFSELLCLLECTETALRCRKSDQGCNRKIWVTICIRCRVRKSECFTVSSWYGVLRCIKGLIPFTWWGESSHLILYLLKLIVLMVTKFNLLQYLIKVVQKNSWWWWCLVSLQTLVQRNILRKFQLKSNRGNWNMLLFKIDRIVVLLDFIMPMTIKIGLIATSYVLFHVNSLRSNWVEQRKHQNSQNGLLLTLSIGER